MPAPPRLVAWFRWGRFLATEAPGTAGPLRPGAAYGVATPAESRARWALRLFTAVVVGAAGLLLVTGLLVLVVSGGSPTRTAPLAADSSLASNGHRATSGRDSDRKSGGRAQQAPRSVAYSRPASHRVRAGTGRRDGRGGPGLSQSTRTIASFAGDGDMITRRFTVHANAGWQPPARGDLRLLMDDEGDTELMNPVTNAGDLAGLILLSAASLPAAALAARRAIARYAAPRRAALAAMRAGTQATAVADAAEGDGLVEDRIASPAALQLEEAVGPGDQQYAIPQPRGVLAARDR